MKWIKRDSKILKNTIAVMMALLVTGFAYILPSFIYVTSGVIAMSSKDTPEKRLKMEKMLEEWFAKHNINDVYVEMSGRTYDNIELENFGFSAEVIHTLVTETELLSMLKERGFVSVTFYNESTHKVSFVYLL